ncbi:MAG: choice-of-anchor Q domain-containing protein [Anaerolineales bacterium]
MNAGSNAIDSALPLAWITHDVDGDARPLGAAPDLGADEVHQRVFLPLVLRAG